MSGFLPITQDNSMTRPKGEARVTVHIGRRFALVAPI
jgi:hypothetical protein